MKRKLSRQELRRLLIKEAKVILDPQGIQSMRGQRMALYDNFEQGSGVAIYKSRLLMLADDPRFSALKIAMPLLKCEHIDLAQISEFVISGELDHGMSGLIDAVLGVDV